MRRFGGGLAGALGDGGIGANREPEASASLRRRPVVLDGQRGDRRREVIRELAKRSGRRKPDLGFHCERGEFLVDGGSAFPKQRDVAHQRGGRGNQVRAREAIARLRRIVGERAEHRRIDDEGTGSDLQPALDAPAPLPLLDQLEKPLPLELAQVVVQLLTRETEAGRQARRGLGLVHLLEHAQAQGREEGCELRRVGDDLHGAEVLIRKIYLSIWPKRKPGPSTPGFPPAPEPSAPPPPSSSSSATRSSWQPPGPAPCRCESSGTPRRCHSPSRCR